MEALIRPHLPSSRPGTAQAALGRERDAQLSGTQALKPTVPLPVARPGAAVWAVPQVGGPSGASTLSSAQEAGSGGWARVPSSTAAAGAHCTLPRGVPTQAWHGWPGHSWQGGQAKPC